MANMHNEKELETLYGPLYPFADHKRGEQIYFRDEHVLMLTGFIMWISAPTVDTPLRYIVVPERGGTPDEVLPANIIE